MRSFLSFVAVSLLVLACRAQADEAYASAEQAKLPPAVMEQLASLKRAGVSEVLVPTWFPEDLGGAGGRVETSDGSPGPKLEIVWPSSKNELRSLVLRGLGAGPDAPGPDSVVAVENPVLGDIEMMVYSNTRNSYRYGTAYGLVVPRGEGAEYCLDLQTFANSPIGLSSPEMQKILGSVRKLKL